MKYEFTSMKIENLNIGEIVDIPDNSLILNCITSISNTLQAMANSNAGMHTDPKFVTYINILVPLKKEQFVDGFKYDNEGNLVKITKDK